MLETDPNLASSCSAASTREGDSLWLLDKSLGSRRGPGGRVPAVQGRSGACEQPARAFPGALDTDWIPTARPPEPVPSPTLPAGVNPGERVVSPELEGPEGWCRWLPPSAVLSRP